MVDLLFDVISTPKLSSRRSHKAIVVLVDSGGLVNPFNSWMSSLVNIIFYLASSFGVSFDNWAALFPSNLCISSFRSSINA